MFGLKQFRQRITESLWRGSLKERPIYIMNKDENSSSCRTGINDEVDWDDSLNFLFFIGMHLIIFVQRSHIEIIGKLK